MNKPANEIRSIVELYGREKFIKMAIEATAALFQNVDVLHSARPLSPKAQLLKEHCISLGPAGPKLARICSILIEEDILIVDPNRKIPFRRNACIVPKVKHDSHNYAIGDPIFMILFNGSDEKTPDTIRCIRKDGTLGNNINPLDRIITIADKNTIIKTVNEIFDKLG